jgi:phasin
MADDPFKVPQEMRALAEQSVAQARKAFDGFMTATHETVARLETQTSSVQAGTKDMTRKAVGFAEKNVASSFDFAQRLLQAKDAEEVMRLHAQFVKEQMQTLSDQTRELGQSAAETMTKARPKS